jgi:hypothetical protein
MTELTGGNEVRQHLFRMRVDLAELEAFSGNVSKQCQPPRPCPCSLAFANFTNVVLAMFRSLVNPDLTWRQIMLANVWTEGRTFPFLLQDPFKRPASPAN